MKLGLTSLAECKALSDWNHCDCQPMCPFSPLHPLVAALQVKVKMATADDEMTTDIAIEGDPEEIDRFRKVCVV